MFELKRIWALVFGFVLFVLPGFPTVVLAADPTPDTAVCLIGDHLGIIEFDAQTAARLICDALRKQGISVSEPVYKAPASTSAYRLVLRRLGRKIFVRLSQENPIGTIIIERQMTLANIEEMIPVAPRLVDALIHDKPIDSTVEIEDHTEQETRMHRRMSSEHFWSTGIFGTFIPGTDITGAPGFEAGWYSDTPAYAVGSEYRVSWRSTNNKDDRDSFFFHTVSIGGHLLSKKRNISPYVGGGLSITGAIYRKKVKTKKPTLYYDHRYDSEYESGFGFYGVVGIEALRFNKGRLKFQIRVDRPFFKLPNQDLMPITFGVSLSHNYFRGRWRRGWF